MTAEQVKELLGLAPHPREGGWYARTWESGEHLAASAFADGRYPSDRQTGTAIYYLLEPWTFSEMHRLRSAEIFHHYAGDAVDQLQLMPDGSGRVVVLGKDLLAGERPQIVVERGVWQGARLVKGGQWALLGCTVTPGFEYDDYEAGTRQALRAGWPEWEALLLELTRT